jgi:hypothetical protein
MGFLRFPTGEGPAEPAPTCPPLRFPSTNLWIFLIFVFRWPRGSTVAEDHGCLRHASVA